MSPTPTVCAVMLTANRTELARRAIECFRQQTYPAARLLVFDTGLVRSFPESRESKIGIFHVPNRNGLTIGELRNLVAEGVSSNKTGRNLAPPDIICHFDDDDWSHANRIAEQVALLNASAAEAVGYREMLFWREGILQTNADLYGEEKCAELGIEPRCGASRLPGEAWLYSSGDTRYCLGTSLCYWRETWERKPFEATVRGEDWRWLSGIRSEGITSVISPGDGRPILFTSKEPRMIARIHPGNARNYDAADMLRSEKQGGEWKRVPAWDAHCRAVMA